MTLKSLIDEPKKLIEFISERLKPKDIEKHKFGEVFTPMKLVNEMVDKLPNDLFTNENLKWYDPANGMGNFPISVYFRLMEGLKDKIKDKNKRKKHILENMLYMSELNKKNVYICKQIFDINNEYKLNIYEGDSLKLDIKKQWNIDGFDIIMGNPPYQTENKKTKSAKGGTNNNLYLDFVENSLTKLNKNGYLMFIHPQNWRKIGSKILSKFLDKTFIHLSLNYGGEYFEGVSVKTDYYVLKNAKENIKTDIDCYYNKTKYNSSYVIDRKLVCIPNLYNIHVGSILEKIQKYGKEYVCIMNSDCHKVRPHVKQINDEVFKYPLFNTSGNPYSYFSSREHKNQYDNKVILSNSGKLGAFYDDGKLGTTQDSMYILVKNKKEGECLVNTLNSTLFKFLIEIMQWSNFRNEAKLFSYFKYPNTDKNVDDDFIIKYYNLSKEEIQFVTSMSELKKTKSNLNDDSEDEKPKKIKKTTTKKEKVINNDSDSEADEKPKKKVVSDTIKKSVNS